MIKVTISYSGNTLSKQFAAGTTVDAVLKDKNLQAALGFGGNVEAQDASSGATLAADTQLTDGDVLNVVTKANSKAA